MNRSLRRAFGAAASVLTALGAAQAAVLGVARIEITLTDTTGAGVSSFLQVAEVVAMSGGADVALTGTASASGSSTWPTLVAGSAIDGNTGGAYFTDVFYHSGTGDANPVLTIDFGGAAFDLDSLAIWGRTDCCLGRDVYTVKLYGLDGAILFEEANLAANGSFAAANLTPVPLPGALALFGPAIAGLIAARRRRA